jgi:hypothetical protein
MQQLLEQQQTINELRLMNQNTLNSWRNSITTLELALEKQKNSYLEIIRELQQEIERLNSLVPINN